MLPLRAHCNSPLSARSARYISCRRRSAREHRQALRQSAVRFSRNPNDIKMFAGFMFSLGSTEDEALERRKQLMSFNPGEIPSRVVTLSL